MEIDSINSFSSICDEYDIDQPNSGILLSATSKPASSAETDQSAIYIHKGSPKAAFRKFVAENKPQVQFVAEETLANQFKSGTLQQQVEKKKIDPNTLIHKAILENAPEVLGFLLNHGVEVDYPDANGMSPLTIAILSQQPKIVKLLLENGADVSPEKKWNDMSLLEISMNARDLESVKYLVAYGADVNASFKNGMTPVEIAINGKAPGEIAMLDLTNYTLISILVDSDKLSQKSIDQTFIGISRRGEINSIGNDLFLKLIKKGADVNNPNGQVLYYSCARGNFERVEMLLNNGANPNLSLPDGTSPLMLASSNNISIMKALIDAGANPNQFMMDKGRDGILVPVQSPLVRVIDSSSADVLVRIKLLIDAGADIRAKINGKTPLEHALEKGRMDVVKYLLEQINKD